MKVLPFLYRSLLCLSLLAFPPSAEAASWQWTSAPGRERLTFQLDSPNQQTQVSRDGEQSLRIDLTPPPASLEVLASPSAGALVRGAELSDGRISLALNSQAFGFISTRPVPGQLVIEVYADPLGARWRPGGSLASLPAQNIPPAAAMVPPPVAATPETVMPQPAMPEPPMPEPAMPEPSTPQPAMPTPQTNERADQTTASVPQPVTVAQADPASLQASAVPPTSIPPAPSSSLNPPQAQSAPLSAVPANSVMPSPANAVTPQSATVQTPVAVPPVMPQSNGLSSAQTTTNVLPGTQPVQPAPNITVNISPAGQGIPQTAQVTPSVPAAQQAPAQQIPVQQAPTQQAPTWTAPASVPPAQYTPTPVTSGQTAPNTTINIQAPPAVPQNSSPAMNPAATPGNVTLNMTQSAAPFSPPPAAALAPVQGSNPAEPQSVIRAKLNLSGPPTLQGQSGTQPPLPQTGTQSPAPVTPPSQTSVTVQSPTQPVAPGQSPDISSSPEPANPAPAQKSEDVPAETEQTPAEPQIQPIYVDEQGNPVPPPPDIPKLLEEMRALMHDGKYTQALPVLDTLYGANLSRDEREEVLYAIMNAKYEASRPKFEERAEELITAANEAMNFDLDSPKVPEALSVLASVSLARGHLTDAQGYVHLMHRKYPTHPNVPSSFLQLGEKQMNLQDYADASMSFQTILQQYPESKSAKDAARLQTYALYRQGHRQRAMTLVDFVERRWPRIYLEDPDYLSMAADIETGEGRLDDALRTYWTQYNLTPVAPESAGTLLNIAHLYHQQNKPDAASTVLEELVRAFPKSAEAPKALMVLGEYGLTPPNPDVDELFALFEKTNPRLPSIYYQRVVQEYPDSPESMTAQLRTIAWQLWNNEFVPAMNAARSFMIDFEDKPESLRARDILLRGFAHELDVALSEENFERVVSLWERFPQVHDYYQPLEPDLRVALARGQLNRGKEAEGMELLAPFLDGPQDPQYGFYTYNLYLAAWLRQQNWDGILGLGEKVANWDLPQEARDQLDYAQALSAENLGLQGRALPLWQKLAPREDIPLYQRAYASYFLAREAERRQDLRAAYQYNLDSLAMFTQLEDEQSPYADPERVRESIAALMDVTEIAGRFAESLEWANRYAVFVPNTSPDYAGLRFREARLHRKMGDMARWRALLQGIIDKEPDSVFGKMAASELHTQDVARDLTRFTGP